MSLKIDVILGLDLVQQRVAYVLFGILSRSSSHIVHARDNTYATGLSIVKNLTERIWKHRLKRVSILHVHAR